MSAAISGRRQRVVVETNVVNPSGEPSPHGARPIHRSRVVEMRMPEADVEFASTPLM